MLFDLARALERARPTETTPEPRRDAVREVTSHKLGPLNEAIKITATGPEGPGGACLGYRIEVPSPGPTTLESETDVTLLHFQAGNPSVEVNGISNEALLAIVADRLEGFQRGPYSCRENDYALAHVQDAMHWLEHRTRDRLKRGVEGQELR
jgi:hypothetical protein